MKKALTALLALIMLAALSACRAKPAPSDSSNVTSNAEPSYTNDLPLASVENDTDRDPIESTAESSSGTVTQPQGPASPTIPAITTTKPQGPTSSTVPTTTQAVHTHSYTEKMTPPTCTKKGYTTYTCACGHTYTGNEISAKGHSYSKKVTPPTCTKKGYTTYTCACGHTYTGNETSAKGHSFGGWKTTKEPTLTAEGTAERICSKCSAKETKKLEKTKSNYEMSKGLKLELYNNGKEYYVSGIGSATDTEISIASTYNGLLVTGIGERAFEHCSSITNIKIPNTVTNISDYAFFDCSNLETVTFEAGSKLTSIGEGTFQVCRKLKDFELPDTVKTIGYSAFSGCESLMVFQLPDGITTINGFSFSACKKLATLMIPKSVTTINDYSFSGCSSLTTIIYHGTSTQWYAINKSNNWNNGVKIAVVMCDDGWFAPGGASGGGASGGGSSGGGGGSTGSTKCYQCNGSGYKECGGCDGAGEVFWGWDINNNKDYIICRLCQGSGERPCAYCGGDGMFP